MKNTILALIGFLSVAIVASFLLEWHLADRSLMGRKRTNSELVGKRVEEILYNTPILPDHIWFATWCDAGIVLEYYNERVLGMEYPARTLYVKNGIIVRATTDGEDGVVAHD